MYTKDTNNLEIILIYFHFLACNCNLVGSSGSKCDKNTGICDCNIGYSGTKCSSCTEDFYGYPNCIGKYSISRLDIVIPIYVIIYFAYSIFKACNCNVHGSNSMNCDDSGVCNCKANIINDQCDVCEDGFFNFPTCEGKRKKKVRAYINDIISKNFSL